MSFITVDGVVDSNTPGVFSPHEHVFVDIRNQYSTPEKIERRALGDQEVSLENLDELSRDPYAVRDNLVLEDHDAAVDELVRFKAAGGSGLVDATSRGIGRDPVKVQRISRDTGLHIIAGCGYYTSDTHPADMNQKTVEEIENEIMDDIQSGIGETGIRAGVIGELGTGEVIHPDEKKVLTAAARAQVRTGAGIMVHAYPWGKRGIEALSILTENGVDPGRISINHVDVVIDTDYCRSIVDRGAYIEFDNFGKEYFIDRENRGYAGGVFARDIERVQAIADLVEDGYVNHILISCDVCLKTLLHRYGGWGYDHILTHIDPMMRESGIGPEHIDTILEVNPKRFLSV